MYRFNLFGALQSGFDKDNTDGASAETSPS